ncbi:bifunctional DNA-formamidopyrimidine glycosylase/DNA-(apurinic or apyrimidinic site) lyase [Gemella sp. GH3]|uniref:bifunctional DNA-formamidopyrimidine glycosylase/DNA-(apurinic or apyrimidinic site) lyase n=1 Tax=unclassified Gemella TaxID=2624949 RepID=UPI0015D0017D|nr:MULTISPECIES: bifunctional DNA-formamidopyrimidine glycosylase/DNA-(apurinic or apyrimidinic site) lyase [unclassified Gemella]MBF0714633.1 bifunctional DNA-formamidopyrimidine glycosylase/DNA-(apurinic or apyrimidinic site) lyase [Gemella sp. GH3.1]NYS51585.1 bifunctional DNA-formamidopyrimidine glycosylase/DNA-(apurinic or apyrimidinic site) lyase [Gemella sp. GH3]
MPELPEVENIKIGLKPNVINKKILNVTYSNIISESHKNGKLALVKDELSYFSDNVIGKEILDLERRGKYVYFTLNEGYLVTHFGMTGAYFVVNDEREITNKNYYKHRHIIFELSTGEKLVFSDIRRFGELRYLDNISNFKPFKNLAPEPFENNSLDYFLAKLEEKKYKLQKIKALLLEGNVFCGCGNIYACEVLYREKINPERTADSLTLEEKKRIFETLVEILKFSITQGGSTISDYVHSDGGEGNMQNYLKIYGKKECPLGHETENIIIKTRSTYFCPVCQKN